MRYRRFTPLSDAAAVNPGKLMIILLSTDIAHSVGDARLKPHTPAIPDNNLIDVSVFLKVANECKKLAGLGAESLSCDSLISQLTQVTRHQSSIGLSLLIAIVRECDANKKGLISRLSELTPTRSSYEEWMSIEQIASGCVLI
jgi:hypothetical protein